MKAVVFERFGAPEVLHEMDMAIPNCQPGQVLIEVYATGLNPADYKLRDGSLAEVFGVTFPRILGGDVAGVVAEVGEGVRDLEVGDTVLAAVPLDTNGGYAEYCTVDERFVARKPDSISFVDAASLPVVGLTAVQALRDFANIKKGDKTLIHAGAGGVGSFAIQYAARAGARVYTTARAEKHDYLKSLGAHHVIDYISEDFANVARDEGGMDIVLETIGGDTYERSLVAAKSGAAVPCIVHPPPAPLQTLAQERQIKTDFLLLQGNRKDLELISDMMARGQVTSIVSEVIAMSGVVQAHRQLESGRTRGKIVLDLKSR